MVGENERLANEAVRWAHCSLCCCTCSCEGPALYFVYLQSDVQLLRGLAVSSTAAAAVLSASAERVRISHTKLQRLLPCESCQPTAGVQQLFLGWVPHIYEA